MKKRILIYGGTDLSAAESRFVESLTYALLQDADTTIITGGFLSSKKSPGAISTDYSILQGAIKYSKEKNIELNECLETWLPDGQAEKDPAKRDVERFREGNVKELLGESAQARRFCMVKDVDVLITIKGKKYTAMVLDFALTINKPAFPLVFTGGDSLVYWKANKDRIKQWFDIDEFFVSELEIEKTEVLTFPNRNDLINKIVGSVNVGIHKELSNNERYNRLQQEWTLNESLTAQSLKNDITEVKVEQKKNLPKELKLFLSYSHKDELLKEQLDNHLTALKRSNKISVWNDRKIGGGDNWDETIKEELQNADIILLLISADFMASDYIWKTELKAAIKKHNQGVSKVIPIFLRKCDFKGMPFEKLQGYPKNAKPVTSFSEREQDEVFSQIVEGIRNDIERWSGK